MSPSSGELKRGLIKGRQHLLLAGRQSESVGELLCQVPMGVRRRRQEGSEVCAGDRSLGMLESMFCHYVYSQCLVCVVRM